jgi:hypothetical protein
MSLGTIEGTYETLKICLQQYFKAYKQWQRTWSNLANEKMEIEFKITMMLDLKFEYWSG